jgi:peptide deformylase
MSVLKIARLGHPVLRQVAEPIPPDQIRSAEIQRLIADMLETVVEYEGAGLAAPQVHCPLRIVVLSLDETPDFDVWINPELTPTTDAQMESWEGCLSVPGMRGLVARPAGVEVKALGADGAPIHLMLTGFPAVVAQHECDHLNGIIYVDLVPPGFLAFNEELRRFGTPDDDEGWEE